MYRVKDDEQKYDKGAVCCLFVCLSVCVYCSYCGNVKGVKLYVLHVANLLTFNFFCVIMENVFSLCTMYMEIQCNTHQTVRVWGTYNVPLFWQFINPACINLKHLQSISDLDQHVESTGILNACVYRIPVGVYFLVKDHVNIPSKQRLKVISDGREKQIELPKLLF